MPELGILALDRTPDIERMLPALRRATGVVVAGRAVDAPYWKGGLLPGDVIYMINNEQVGGIDDLRGVLDKLSRYDAVVIQIERQGRLQFLAFELE